jgi:hypothetical protein
VAVVNGYCSVDDVRLHVNDSEFNSLEVALIERAINAASRAIDKYCGFPLRKFWKDATPTTRVYAPNDWQSIWISDLADRTGVVVGIGTDFTTLLTTGQYELGPSNVDQFGGPYAFTRLTAIGSQLFPMDRTGRPTVRITGLHGWSAVPDEVIQACVLKSTSLLKRKDAVFGVAGFGEFGTAVRIRAEDPDVADLLGPFRRYGAGTTG